LEYYGSTGGEKLLNFTYAYCGGNPFNRIDPDGRWDISDFQALCNNVNAAIRKVKNGVKKVVKYVNKETEKHFGTPFITLTNTNKISAENKLIDTGFLGDKLTKEKSVSTKIGKGKGLINLDVTTNNNKFESISASTKLGNAFSINTSLMIGYGQSIGDSEFHMSRGPGVGLGEYGFGWSTTVKGATIGKDIDVRPGVGTAAAVAATVLAPEAVASAVATTVAKYISFGF
jgi:hypothetical protein